MKLHSNRPHGSDWCVLDVDSDYRYTATLKVTAVVGFGMVNCKTDTIDSYTYGFRSRFFHFLCPTARVRE
jgi:hypothetical protein